MEELRNIGIITAFCFAVATAFAQTSTTYQFQAPQYCGVWAANYTCTLKIAEPSGDVGFYYQPRWNSKFSYVQFADLGRATVTAVTTTHLAHVDNGKRNGNTLLQGYIGMDSYNETEAFTGGGFTGSTDLNFTTTTQCCSSGRGASAHTSWSVTSGTVTIVQ